ncbi:MAG: ABC transporter ATP-binding protein [Clostridia bacterium]|nr:ABC transporter ATP-binding protein [Clostridia bacterium]
MLKTLKKFFAFSGSENKKKFTMSIFLGVVMAFATAMKIPAIWIMVKALIANNVTYGTVLTCFLIMLISVILDIALRAKSSMLQTDAGYASCANKRIEIAEHLRYLPMGYFNDNSLGYITSVTTNVMENMADVATRVVMMTTKGWLETGVIIFFLFVYQWQIGLVALAGVLVFYFVNFMMQTKNAHLAPIKTKADSELVTQVLEYIHGITEIKAFDLAGEQSEKLNTAIEENRKINTDMEMGFIGYMAAQNFVTKAIGVVMTILSLYLYFQGKMTLDICIVMIISGFMIYSALESAGSFSALLRTIDVSIDKAQEILDMPAMDISGETKTPKTHNITVKNIEFSYDDRKIIDGISADIKEKTTTAIVGPSGGGKTTLCNLMSRFWDVDSGIVELDGKDIKEYSMDSLMQNYSFVFQRVYLFRDTIANNIRFGEPDAPMEKVIDAAKKACCHEFISALPNGYETMVGEGGANLSGGEKQRISIARAIMKDAPIIVLDEATANVDPENEKDLVEAIEALTQEKTIIMIAHRLKTISHADQILVINKGKLVQQGKHSELMAVDGIYKRFVNAREQAVNWQL